MIARTNGGFLVSRIKQVGGRIFERMLTEAGVDAFNGAQGRILHVLWQRDSIPIVELSQKTGLAKTTLTSMLDRMEQAGLVTRVYDASDRRRIRIRLSEQAQALSGQYERISAAMNAVFYDGFTDDEIRAFETYLQRILDNLETNQL